MSRSPNGPFFVLTGLMLAFMAFVSFISAPTIGLHDGGWAYLIVTGCAFGFLFGGTLMLILGVIELSGSGL